MSTSTTMPVLSLDEDDSITKRETVTLVFPNGETIVQSRKNLLISGMVKEALSGDVETKEIIIKHEADSKVLSNLSRYITQHKGSDLELPEHCGDILDLKSIIKSDWDLDYINGFHIEVDQLCKLIEIANYFDIPGLLRLCAIKFASMIRNKSQEEIATLFKGEKVNESKTG